MKVILLTQKHVDKVLVCDAGSTDMTGEIAEKLGADVMRHKRNLGYGAARELDVGIMITLDGDGQHDPNDIPLLVKPILEGGADVVVGSRFLEKAKAGEVPLYRRLGIKAITRLTGAASSCRVGDAQSGFRAYGRRALEGSSTHGASVVMSIMRLVEEEG